MCCHKRDQSEIRAVYSLFALPLTKQPNLIMNYTDSFFQKYTKLSYNYRQVLQIFTLLFQLSPCKRPRRFCLPVFGTVSSLAVCSREIILNSDVKRST